MPLVAHPASKGGHGGRDLLWSSIVSRRKLSLEAERTNDLPVDITERVIPEHFSWGSSLQRAQLRRGHAVPVAPVARPQGVGWGGGGEHCKVNANSALQGRRDFCACGALNQGCAKESASRKCPLIAYPGASKPRGRNSSTIGGRE